MWCEFVCILKKLPTLLNWIHFPGPCPSVAFSSWWFNSTWIHIDTPRLCRVVSKPSPWWRFFFKERRSTNADCSGLQDEQGASPIPPNVQVGIGEANVPSSSSVNLNPAESNPNCDCSWSRFCCSSWSRLIWSSTGVRCCDWRSFRLLLISMLLVVLRCNCGWSCSAGASENARKSNKNGKNQSPISGRWFREWPGHLDRNKTKQKREKTIINIMERVDLSLGKTQKREKTTSTKQTREKFGKPQWEARCVRECRFGGSFFRLFRNERVSSSRTLMLSWPIPFLSPCSFHPPCLTLDPRRMNLSSILRCWSDSQLVCQLRVGMDYFVLNPCTCPYLSSECGKVVENCANVFGVIIIVYTRTTRTKPLCYNRVQW